MLPTSPEAFAATALALTLPTFYILSRRPTTSSSRPPYRTPLTLLVLAHTIYILHSLLRQPPPNIFVQYRIPVNIPIDGIRAILLARAGEAFAMAAKTDALLTRLASFDTRILYVRFGQRLIAECTHCRSFDEYALHALPLPLLQYVREVAVIGLITIRGSHRARWRTWGVAILAVAGFCEAYWVLTVPIELPRGGTDLTWWHDMLWTARHALFLLLPVLTHLAPARPPRSPARLLQSLPRITMLIDSILKRTSLARLSGAAVARDPVLQVHSRGWWERERSEGEVLRRDVGVQRVAEKEGFGFGADPGEGKGTMRIKAEEMMEELWKGFHSTLDSHLAAES